MNIYETIKDIFANNGVDIQNECQLKEVDSFQYVSILVEIESTLGLTLPDEFLTNNALVNIYEFVKNIEELYNGKQ